MLRCVTEGGFPSACPLSNHVDADHATERFERANAIYLIQCSVLKQPLLHPSFVPLHCPLRTTHLSSYTRFALLHLSLPWTIRSSAIPAHFGPPPGSPNNDQRSRILRRNNTYCAGYVHDLTLLLALERPLSRSNMGHGRLYQPLARQRIQFQSAQHKVPILSMVLIKTFRT